MKNNHFNRCLNRYNYYITKARIRQEWTIFLNSFNWDWFATLTFKNPPKTYTAINQVKRWLRALQREEKRKIGYYLCMELTKAGVPHFHLLMGNLQGVRRDKWWKKWFERCGRARILPFEKNKGAGYYLTKYVLKDEYTSAGLWEVENLELLKQGVLDLTKNQRLL